MPQTTSQTSNRVYTRRDEAVERALEHVVAYKLAPAQASVSEKVHALIEWADERLVADHEREAKLAAYAALAADEERREAIYQANLTALDNGVL